MIELSSHYWVRPDIISSCEIVKRDDDCYHVKWITDDGDILSDVFTGRVAASNYVKSIIEEIKSLEECDE